MVIENQYFQSSPWKEEALSANCVGVASLQRFLQKLLEQHIERELPRVREETKHINRLDQEIAALGDERPTTGHLRVFLSRLAMRFHDLTSPALDGKYFDSVLMSDLFHVQASRWEAIAGEHLEAFSDAIEELVKAAIGHIT